MRTSTLFLWLLTFVVFLGGYTPAVSGQCYGSQRSLLIQLKNSLAFNSSLSKKLVKWNSSSDCCSWAGVSCEEGLVTRLDLSNEDIAGGLDNSSSLFNLQHLKSLDLSWNIFSSTIPSRIGNLTYLSYLNLSTAGFVGQIPVEVSQLRRLITLDLSTVDGLKLENPDLRKLVRNLSQLQELRLDGVNVSAPGAEWCGALSSSLLDLRVLSLSNCQLSGPIDQSLKKLRSLSVIKLDGNNFSAPVPQFFANFSNLTTLSLWNSGLHGTLSSEIFLQVPTLQVLDLSGNMMLHGSLPKFPKDNSLKILRLSSTKLSGTLHPSIGNLWNLTNLELAYCNFYGSLPDSIGRLSQLVSLDLSFNNFTGPTPSFNTSKNLIQISLSHNGLIGEVPSSHWQGLSNLVTVDLSYNFLGGNIPLSLFSLPSLEVIILSNNRFSGSYLEFQTMSSSRLKMLDLSYNNLEGHLPTSMFELRNLSTLSLSWNKFNGSLELDMFRGLDKLRILDLSHNRLSVIPSGNDSMPLPFPLVSALGFASCHLNKFPNLGNLPFLTDLDLSDNQLHGHIPMWIWEGRYFVNLSSNYLVGFDRPYSLPDYLSVIDLHSNQLGGDIPFIPKFAQYVDFSNNNFSSSIPVDIFNSLSYLGFFSLSNNSLTGVIPESICSASSLRTLDLSENSLSGRIPICISEMSQTLAILNLRSNKLSGLIPDNFPANCSLKTLVLDENLIEGIVPKSLESCNALEVLDIGKNMMIDKFPCMLKKMSTLRVIVLRSNCFYGSIECPNTNGTWLPNLQIFDLANNSFSGKIPIELLAESQAMIVGVADQINYRNSDILGFSFWYISSYISSFESYSKVYYRYSVTVTSKGNEMELLKILKIFTSVDLSCNNFSGPIPEGLGTLQALYVMNLSNNALVGEISSSFGNLRKLESLDLSRNNLSGSVPPSLASLNFLSFLNLSFNQLVGRIPTGNQIQTFSADSFIGNEGLCGFPLTKNCTTEAADVTPIPNTSKDIDSNYGSKIDWNWLTAEMGFITGVGIVIGPLLFCKRWRRLYFERVDDNVIRIFPSAVSRRWVLWTSTR